jgi:hypothetical protein
MNCRVCKNKKELKDFTKRGKSYTKTCIECSNERALKDYCDHGTRNHDCYKCNNPIKRRALMMLKTKATDKVKGRANDLTYDNVKDLLMSCTDLCCYCGIDLQHETKNKPNYSSIERIHNSEGHIISNCLISCLECNISRRGDIIWNY